MANIIYRQIRNAFQTAIALAEFEASEKGTSGKNGGKKDIELQERHFAKVAEASKEFDKYLRSTLGGQSEADVARLEQTRVDDFHKLVERVEYETAQKARDKGKRRGKIEFDSEDSESLDSEESDDNEGSSKSDTNESSEEEPIPVKVVKSKKEGKTTKKSRNK